MSETIQVAPDGVTQLFTCSACGHVYQAPMEKRFVRGAGWLAEYHPAPDPGCPKCGGKA